MDTARAVVVTGASTGIGRACARALAASGFRVFASVRKQEHADGLTAELGANVTPLIFDVTDVAGVSAAAAAVDAQLAGMTLFGLVNNAGIAVAGPLLHLPVDEFKRQLDVNVTGQLVVTKAFAPLLGADRARDGSPGRIVMITSVGGRNALPFAGPYATSKFALEGLSEALRRELMLFGIDVIIVAPGSVVTPIWDKTEDNIAPFTATPYAGALERMKTYMLAHAARGLPAERIGEAVKTALTTGRPKTRYTVTPNPLQTFLTTALPKRMIDKAIARRIGLLPT
ncbi:MAG: SDR family NAD(P)-dependent oxidoreductase [Enhydrobacter sp.]|nr:MAG: SDR family NAD(P)-dependent oxidoreductase [Enhydrobacter sp.]